MKKGILFLGLMLSVASPKPALAVGLNNASRVVIDELRKLKATLPVNDPSRGEITLRLADRLADECLVGKDKTLVKTDADRTEAIALYQESLPIRSGEAKIKIQFQMARLYAEKATDASAAKSAKELFELVRTASQVKELKRESNLRLAEFAENNPKTASAAVAYYREALTLCEGTDSCSYSHYRLGWIERNHENLPAAIEEMKLALWDSKGQLREEAIRDLVTFMGLASAQVEQSIPYMDQLSTKVNRPVLLQDLAYAYFSSGNKAAGVKVLALTHARAPTVYGEMRLMEEYYGLRQWDQFRAVLAEFNNSVHAAAVAPVLSEKDAVEIEKIGRRLATQLDGERTSDPTHFEDFKQFTLSYLDLFPRSPERAKIMEGMIAAEPNAELKLSQLKTWLSSPQFALPVTDEVKLRELRAAIAQKTADKDVAMNAVIIEEMSALVIKNPAKSREYRYVRARAQYAQKDLIAAAPEFAALATIQGTPDTFAIQSQHLLLDIYNQQKDLAKIVVQAKSWTTNESINKNPKFAADIKEMSQVAEEAEFQGATQQAESVETLAVFMDYCKNGKFLPKSCENAKVLSVKLNQHPKLIAVLELQAKTNPTINAELMDQYEDGGYFAKAATMMSAAKAAPDFKAQVKTALLYEVGRDNAGRDSILRQITQSVMSKKMKLAAPEEKAMLSFLNDTHLLNASLLNAVQTPESKNYLAENLEEQNLGNKQTLQILLSQTEYQGTAWSKRVVEKADALANEESKIKFYGRNGQVAFQKRVNRLKELNQFSDKYLNGSDALTRTKLLSIVKNSHEKIGEEIMASPLPPNLSEEQLNQVKTSLAEMAKPFHEKAETLKKLLETEEQKVSLTQSSAKTAIDEAAYQAAITQLHQNPKNVAALTQLKTLFANAGQGRPAAYFEGRVQGL